mmetsp:Transcript_16883/g.36441  ORF Transcript_16883/g.36441 Transcript_16883/m.36441 type:complete len:226 (-) Transcript_16883:2203-2880(-)
MICCAKISLSCCNLRFSWTLSLSFALKLSMSARRLEMTPWFAWTECSRLVMAESRSLSLSIFSVLSIFWVCSEMTSLPARSCTSSIVSAASSCDLAHSNSSVTDNSSRFVCFSSIVRSCVLSLSESTSLLRVASRSFNCCETSLSVDDLLSTSSCNRFTSDFKSAMLTSWLLDDKTRVAIVASLVSIFARSSFSIIFFSLPNADIWTFNLDMVSGSCHSGSMDIP